MTLLKKQVMSIFVNRSSHQWIVCDPDGVFWTVPPVEQGWDQRQPFTLTDDCELEPIPGHYKYLLDLPF